MWVEWLCVGGGLCSWRNTFSVPSRAWLTVLLTIGTFWLNPPLPMAEDGSLYGAKSDATRDPAVAIDLDPPMRR